MAGPDGAQAAEQPTKQLPEPVPLATENPHFTQSPRRIALLHLDSLCCLPALDHLFSALENRTCLVISSDRFAGDHGFWRQLRRTLSHSGVRMTLALGFDIVALRIAAFFAPVMRWPARLAGKHVPLRTLREHAQRVGAAFESVQDINGPAAIALLRQNKPDLVVSFHFDQILRPPFLEAAACPVVNVHPALLPAHRGPCPSFWVLAAAEPTSGITIHRIVDASIDTGEPIVRRERRVSPGMCVAELDECLFKEGAGALVQLLAPTPAASASAPSHFVQAVSSLVADGYESFPDRHAVRLARRRGVRLWRLSHAVWLLMGLFGWRRP